MSLRFSLPFAALLSACGPGKAQGSDAGPPLEASSYFALTAGQCFEYSAVDGGAPDLGLETAAIPGGVALHLSRHGQDSRVDYLTFDGGVALLEGQDIIVGSPPLLRSRAFATPLAYLEAPLATSGASLTSSSAYQDEVAGTDGGSGQEGLEVDVLDESPWSLPSGTVQAFELNLTTTDSRLPAPTTERRWVAPSNGFVDLYLPDDSGAFVHYRLVDIRSVAPPTPCAAN